MEWKDLHFAVAHQPSLHSAPLFAHPAHQLQSHARSTSCAPFPEATQCLLPSPFASARSAPLLHVRDNSEQHTRPSAFPEATSSVLMIPSPHLHGAPVVQCP